ncbi:MAG: histidine triad nucleotide-binding protein [Christensenellales bacterium]|jgi:histidine triad (HIT) family protein
MDNCVFCKIVRGEIPCKKVYEDELVLAFDDISPQAPVHVLLVPKHHAADILKTDVADTGACIAALPKVVAAKGLTSFRLIVNTGADAGQTVPHLHFHILGGKDMGERII